MRAFLLTALIFTAASGASAAERAHRVLVLGSSGAGSPEKARMISEQLGSALARRGFSVMTTGDVRTLFRASGCVDGLGTSEGSTRQLPFQLLQRLSKLGVGVVYGGEVGEFDGRSWIHLVAFDTLNATVVARERIPVTTTKATRRVLERQSKKMRTATAELAGKRVFAGIGGSSGPRSTKDLWVATVAGALKAPGARFSETCRMSPSEMRFDVVVQARMENHTVVVDGDGLDGPLFSTKSEARGGLHRAVDRAAAEVGDEISRVSFRE